MTTRRGWRWLALRTGAIALVAALSPAQAPAVVDDELLEATILAACEALHTAGALQPAAALVAGAATGPVLGWQPAAARRTLLPPPELRENLLASVVIVGHYYRCRDCDAWHFSGSSGFCIGAEGRIASCAHVLPADEDMLESFLVVADLQGRVYPIERVLAHDPKGDLCVVQAKTAACVPLPLRVDVRAGERIYCLSHPEHQFAFFSEGLVARWYAQREPEPAAPAGAVAAPGAQAQTAAARLAELRARQPLTWLHVTCEFATGSSGAPIVDGCGNVVGIVQSVDPLPQSADDAAARTQMVLRSAVPAGVLHQLLAPPPSPAKADAPREPTRR